LSALPTRAHMTKPKAYILCTAPRSGSTLLCALLADTKTAGLPQSYFHRASLSDWRTGLGVTADAPLADVVQSAITKGTDQTPLFGLRLQQHSLAFFMQQLALLRPNARTDRARIDATFGPTRYIYLTRSDKLAQAISLVRAEQSGLWHRNSDGTDRERLGVTQQPLYDRARITAEIETFQSYDAAWTNWFTINEIEPLHVNYHAVSVDPVGTTGKILEFLGQDAAQATDVRPATAQLADDLSAKWTHLYQSGA